nr:hypothetical protein BCU57_10885 [Shewanella sp. 10N.286.48.B5]
MHGYKSDIGTNTKLTMIKLITIGYCSAANIIWIDCYFKVGSLHNLKIKNASQLNWHFGFLIKFD